MTDRDFNFMQVDSEENARTMFEISQTILYGGDAFNKAKCQRFLSDLFDHLNVPAISPKLKFYALNVLRSFILKNEVKFLGVLSSSPQFIEYLQTICETVDPKKNISEKGKTTFSNDSEGFGNRYVHVAVETLMYLGKKFAKNSKGEPTKFKKSLMKVESANVNLPKELTYYPEKNDPNASKKDSNANRAQTQERRPSPPPKKEEPVNNNDKKGGNNVASLVRFTKFKIDEFMANLEDAEEVEDMQEIIMKNHEIFKGELNKFDEFGESLYECGETVVEEYLNVRGFLEAEKESYNEHSQNNQFAPYYDTVKLKYEELFPGSPPNKDHNPKKSKTPMPKNESTLSNPYKDQYNSKNNISSQPKTSNPIPPSELESPTLNHPQINRPDINPSFGKNSDHTVMISGLFERIENRSKSKSPHRGFKELREELDKEKSNIHAHPPSRFKKSTSPMERSNLSKITNSNTHDIFYNPPNPSPSYKNYEGQTVPSNKSLENILFDIKKEQGHRRFKLAILKSKYPLFENESIQIGYKTEPIFEEYDGFTQFLSLELYFGNKTDRQIRNLEISFEGDENSLIFTNPREISPFIDANSQNKHGLMIIPNRIPYSCTSMRVSYQCGNNVIRTTVALPNSILKFAVYEEPSSKNEFIDYWQSVTEKYKTDNFKLTKHIPPNTIRKYMSNLAELTSYSEFSLPASETDYEVCCIVNVNDDYEGALKINIRPDLSVVLQIGAINPSEDAIKILKFYLQSLQMVLEETNG